MYPRLGFWKRKLDLGLRITVPYRSGNFELATRLWATTFFALYRLSYPGIKPKALCLGMDSNHHPARSPNCLVAMRGFEPPLHVSGTSFSGMCVYLVPPHGYIHGADERTRTSTVFPPYDSKSQLSTIPARPQIMVSPLWTIQPEILH